MKIRQTILATAIALVTFGAGAANAANLITNGSFETGDFTGWTLEVNPSFPEYLVTSPVEDGTYAAQIAGFSYSPDTLSQAVSTAAGQSYGLSFWYYQDPDVPSGFTASWDGTTIFSQAPDTGTNGVYQEVSASVVGTGSDTLLFTAYNDPAYAYLDNVSLTAVPEPATWAMLLLGFFGIGFMMRGSRREDAVAIA